jgi:hypothetical protein
LHADLDDALREHLYEALREEREAEAVGDTTSASPADQSPASSWESVLESTKLSIKAFYDNAVEDPRVDPTEFAAEIGAVVVGAPMDRVKFLKKACRILFRYCLRRDIYVLHVRYASK